jgi:hypothetical protein
MSWSCDSTKSKRLGNAVLISRISVALAVPLERKQRQQRVVRDRRGEGEIAAVVEADESGAHRAQREQAPAMAHASDT